MTSMDEPYRYEDGHSVGQPLFYDAYDTYGGYETYDTYGDGFDPYATPATHQSYVYPAESSGPGLADPHGRGPAAEAHSRGFADPRDLGFPEAHDLGFAAAHDLGFPDARWSPEVELAHLLQTQGAPLYEPVVAHDDPVPLAPHPLADMLGESAEETDGGWPVAASPRRRPRRHRHSLPLLRTTSFMIAALAAVIVAMVSVFGGIVAYNPLRIVSTAGAPVAPHAWWPMLVFGPWAVASLSILRAALLQRRAAHSWATALFFSAIAVGLCVAQAPQTGIGWCTAALPPVAALTSFQQLVRQITLTRPPRQPVPRHRYAAVPLAAVAGMPAGVPEQPAAPGSGQGGAQGGVQGGGVQGGQVDGRRRAKSAVPQQKRTARPR